MKTNTSFENKKIIDTDSEVRTVIKVQAGGYKLEGRSRQVPAQAIARIQGKLYLADSKIPSDLGIEKDGYISITAKDLKNSADEISELFPQLESNSSKKQSSKKPAKASSSKKQSSKKPAKASSSKKQSSKKSSGKKQSNKKPAKAPEKIEVSILTSKIAESLQLEIREAVDTLISSTYEGFAPIEIETEFCEDQLRMNLSVSLCTPKVLAVRAARIKHADKIDSGESVQRMIMSKFGCQYPEFESDYGDVTLVGVSKKTDKFVCLLDDDSLKSLDPDTLTLKGETSLDDFSDADEIEDTDTELSFDDLADDLGDYIADEVDDLEEDLDDDLEEDLDDDLEEDLDDDLEEDLDTFDFDQEL